MNDEVILKIIDALEAAYPDSDCTLDFSEPWQLLFSARLAAQCTDKRVNIVAKELYGRFPTLKDIAACDIEELEAIVRPTGLYRVKARDIKSCAGILIDKFGGEVPQTMDELLSLPGIGRKIANLILGDVFNKPGIVTDTHCIRLANRLGLCATKDPYKVELALSDIVPPAKQSSFCHRLVDHGRAVCSARSPRCGECTLYPLCRRVGTEDQLTSTQAKTPSAQPKSQN